MTTLEKLKALRDACILQQAEYTNDLIEVGDFTYGKPIIHQWDKTTRLKIGKFCSIGGNVHILLGGEHHTEWLTTYPFDVLIDGEPTASKGDVEIGNDVWICNDVTIRSGVRIGDGAVIGTGAVVTRDIPEYAIVGGAPAHLKRIRECWPDIRDVAWWDWPIEKIAAGLQLLISEDVGKLIDFDRRWRHGLRDHA